MDFQRLCFLYLPSCWKSIGLAGVHCQMCTARCAPLCQAFCDFWGPTLWLSPLHHPFLLLNFRFWSVSPGSSWTCINLDALSGPVPLKRQVTSCHTVPTHSKTLSLKCSANGSVKASEVLGSPTCKAGFIFSNKQKDTDLSQIEQ